MRYLLIKCNDERPGMTRPFASDFTFWYIGLVLSFARCFGLPCGRSKRKWQSLDRINKMGNLHTNFSFYSRQNFQHKMYSMRTCVCGRNTLLAHVAACGHNGTENRYHPVIS